MRVETRRFAVSMIILLAILLAITGCELVGHWEPAVRRWLGNRVGIDGRHPTEKLATGLLAKSVGILGACLALRRRAVFGLCLIGLCYFIEGVRHEVFYVWEGGR